VWAVHCGKRQPERHRRWRQRRAGFDVLQRQCDQHQRGVRTTSTQSYNGLVNLGAATTLRGTGTGSSVLINTSLVAGAHDLTIAASGLAEWGGVYAVLPPDSDDPLPA
jgi:hypothetical protein